MTESTIKQCDGTPAGHSGCMLNRRQFLLYSGATALAATTISVSLLSGSAHAATQTARVVGYPRKLIARLSQLKDHQPVDFSYPDELHNAQCMLVKMGKIQAGGGIGPNQDIVAYSYLCTHQGGPLQGTYKVTGGEHCTLGPCPLHLSLYDLRRHGIIVSGQAYESLPQVLLELDGDDIYAVGMLGLIFGRDNNLLDGTA